MSLSSFLAVQAVEGGNVPQPVGGGDDHAALSNEEAAGAAAAGGNVPQPVGGDFEPFHNFEVGEADYSIDQNGTMKEHTLKGFTEADSLLFSGDLFDPSNIVKTDGLPWPAGLSYEGQCAAEQEIENCTLTLWFQDTEFEGICFQKKFSTGVDAMAVLCDLDTWDGKYNVYAATIETTDGKVYNYNPGFSVYDRANEDSDYKAKWNSWKCLFDAHMANMAIDPKDFLVLARIFPTGTRISGATHDAVTFTFTTAESVYSKDFLDQQSAVNFHYQCLSKGLYYDNAVIMSTDDVTKTVMYNRLSEMAQYEDDMNALREGEVWAHPNYPNVQLIAVMETGKQKLRCANDETFDHFIRLVRESLSETDYSWNALPEKTGMDTGTIYFDPTIALNESHIMTFIKEKLILTTEQSEAVAFRLSLDNEIAKAGSASSVIKASPSAKKRMAGHKNVRSAKDMKKEKKKQEKKEAKKDRKKVEWTSPAEKEKMDAASAKKAEESRAAQKEKAKAAHVGEHEKAVEEEKERHRLLAEKQEAERKKKQEQLAKLQAFMDGEQQRHRDGEFEANLASMAVGEQKELEEAMFKAYKKDSKQVDMEKPRKGGGKWKGGGKKKKK